jgi:hypothetical protein
MSDESILDPTAIDESGPVAAPAPRKSYPPRVPTLCRLTCQGFEMFFSDHRDDTRMPGLIPRTIIAPWWSGVSALCGSEMEKYERRLKTIIGTGEFNDADQLAVELQKAAIGWTNRLLDELARPEGDRALKQIFENPILITDVREIARILPLSAALKSQLSISFSLLAEADQMEGLRILDLSSDTVGMLKGQYLAFVDSYGPEARYLALALLNRMVRPWQILMLARALSWRPNEPGSPYAEFDIVAHRLVLEVQRMGNELIDLAKSADLAAAMSQIQTRAAQFLDKAEGIAGVLVLRADSPWAETLQDTHWRLAAAFDRPFLDRVSAIVFDAERRPDPASTEASFAGAHFLALLLGHGERFGLAAAARDATAELANRLGDASQSLIEAMRASPDYSLFDGHLQALLRVTEIIFKDGPGAQLARTMRMARQSTAA